ncbi:MAG: hypothetical protein MUE65_05835, partial [Methanomassiliicoccales archaeon]|nr:hypothetical protein [Methanomassiliicoccales archaeon]
MREWRRLALAIAPPGFLKRAMAPPSDPLTREYMERHLISRERMAQEAWGAFLATTVLGALIALPILLLADAVVSAAAIIAALCLPFVLSSWVSNAPARLARMEERAYLRQAPAAIGSMAMSMSLTPSLERAVSFSASLSQGELGVRLSLVSWEVMTRSCDDVESSLSRFASTLSSTNQSLRQSLHLLVASVHEPTKDGMERLMDKAHEISVQGLRQAAERHVASLSTPVMVLFALGILLPIMMLSMAPLLSLSSPLPSGSASAAQLPLAPMAFLLLVLAPCLSFLYARSILEASPTSAMPTLLPSLSARGIAPWLVLAGAFILLASMGAAAEHPCAFLMGMALSSALVIWIAHPAPRPCQTDEERDFIVGLYQIGNRLASGASMERALTEAACTSDGSRFGCWAREVLGCSALSRMSLAEAMETRRAAGRWPLLSEAFRTVARCAQADGVAAGRVAVRLAGSLAD